MEPAKRIRLTLNVSTELDDTLETLARESGTTKSVVLRKAIALMEVAVCAKREGKRLGVALRDQPLETEIIGI